MKISKVEKAINKEELRQKAIKLGLCPNDGKKLIYKSEIVSKGGWFGIDSYSHTYNCTICGFQHSYIW